MISRVCLSVTGCFITREVMIGNIAIGYNNPVRIQSMTNTPTSDIKATVAQAMRIFDAGADFVRMTVPGLKDAANLEKIRNELHRNGYKGPIIADIHFNPDVAEVAAQYVDKVRINPGNYSDKRISVKKEYTRQEYEMELDLIKSRLLRLIDICRRCHTSVRIGTNHGSLSARIVDRYGDSREGMVEATMEFLHIFHNSDFHDLVISLKSSNTRIMVQANRLMVFRMMQEKMNYPIHLGVTEAGDAEDGIIKSAVGIGSLLAEGIGDTLRVSLTGSPEQEIPAAVILAGNSPGRNIQTDYKTFYSKSFNPFEYVKRDTISINDTGNDHTTIVIADLSMEKELLTSQIEESGYRYMKGQNKWDKTDNGADYIYTGDHAPDTKHFSNLQFICNYGTWKNFKNISGNTFPLFSYDEYLTAGELSQIINFIRLKYDQLNDQLIGKIRNDTTAVLVLETRGTNAIISARSFFDRLFLAGCKTPVIIYRYCSETELMELQINSSCDTGFLFIDGLCDGIWLSSSNKSISYKDINSTSFSLLQACRVRFSKTEYISCPSCGRTLFDIQNITREIREKTSHLKNLKIAIMGCMVNGPGEMADADYGYVGAGHGRVTLYKGKEIIKKNISSENAVDELINFIKEFSDWI